MDRLCGHLAVMAPGAELAGMLESVDLAGLSGHERVMVLRGWSRQLAHVQARLLEAMVAVAGAVAAETRWGDEQTVFDLSSSEIGAGLSWTRGAAEFHLGFAQDLVDRYPRVWEALDSGHIDLPRARVLVEQTRHLPSELCDRVCEQVLDKASNQTTGQLRARLQRLVIAVDPDSARKRYEDGVSGRRVVSEHNDSGTGNLLGLDLPAAELNQAMGRINRLARSAKSADDERSMDQIRADVLLDLLTGRDAGARERRRGVVDIKVDLTTLAELDDNPAEIPGWGPVIADIARKVVSEQADLEWRFTVTDPNRGEVVHTGLTRRRPTTSQKRQVHAQTPTCVFPGCRMPARDSDLDHRHAWSEGGPTDDLNLAPLCRHHHRLKHDRWELEMVTPGMFVWTSPLGLTYLVEPVPP
ncbi:MAG TPA: DUF222 domain-containing protein [Acidimicrobiia bacterium]